MQKYYLLTFNEDWADEHYVPALTCFTENEYQRWLRQATGKPNKNYADEKAKFTLRLAASKKYDDLARKSYLKPGSVSKEELLATHVPYVNSVHDVPKKFFSGIHASLGNNGEGFGESFVDYTTGQALVDAAIVSVYEVPKEFFNVFKEVNLSSLSLCNVFDEDLAENVYENEEYYE